LASVELRNLSKSFHARNGEAVRAVSDLNLTVSDGELLTLVGPSGCGKTTTLRLIAGLEQPSSGTVCIGGAAMNKIPPQERDVAMVFQKDALYPHMTVFQNMAFGLQLRRVPKSETKTRVEQTAEMLGLASMLQRYPRTLSGGQRQRAALGRAIVRRPKVFLLDEPLSHLDAPLRTQLRAEILRLHKQLGATMLYVTHDQAEAVALGSRIAVMKGGSLQQVADVATLRMQPANSFVSEFFSVLP
jgi:multiple sugar transport system ATP-binding protein